MTEGPRSSPNLPQEQGKLVEHALLVFITVSVFVAVAPALWPTGPWTWSAKIGYITLAAAAVYVFAYWHLRRGSHKIAARLLVGGLVAALAGVTLIPGILPGERSFAFLSIGIVLAAAALNARSTAVVSGIIMAIIMGLALTRPDYAMRSFGEDVVVMVVMATVLVASATYRERVQSARRAAQADLGRAVQQMEAMLESGPDAMLIIGESGDIRGLNTRAADWGKRYLGIQARQGDSLRELVGDERWTHVAPLLAEAASRSRAHAEMEVPWTPGSMWIDVHVRKAQGAEGAYVVHLRDITASKRLGMQEKEAFTSKLKQKSRQDLESARTRLLNRASHEMRTPLTPLRLQVSILERQLAGRPDSRGARSVSTIKRNVARLTRLVDDLLDASALEADELQLKPQALALDTLLAAEVQAFRSTAQGRHLDIQLQCDVDQPVHADPQRLAQVVGNLLSNACKHASTSVIIEARTIDGAAEVSVTDDGDGFPPERANQLWRPFAEADGPPSHTAGTGLGLFICRRIIEQHGGTVSAESDGPGLGSRFSFTLPAHASLKYEGTPIASHE